MTLTLSPLPHTWILDLDGTLVVHNGYKIYGHDVFLKGAEEFLASLPQNDMIILLTSRTEEYRKQTEQFLKEKGIRYSYLLCGMPYGERIVINDDKPSGLAMAYALRKDRDSDINFTINISEQL